MEHSRKVFLVALFLLALALPLAIFATRETKANIAPNPLPTIGYEPGSDIGKLYVLLAMSESSARKAVYSQFTPDEKSRVWQLHLTLHRLNAQLTPEQDAIYAEAIALVKLMNYADLSASAVHLSRARAAYETAVSAFGEAKARSIFNDLGSALRLSPQANVQKANYIDDCSCSTYWNWCTGGMTCQSGGCTIQNWGCGPLWGWPCDGACKGRG